MGKENIKSSIIVVVTSLLICVSIVVSFSFVFLIYLRIVGNFSSEENIEKLEKYQVFQYEPETKETYVGLITVPNSVYNFQTDEDYHSYYDDTNENYVLISKVGNTEYKCTGQCVCENDRRGGGSVTLQRGLLYFLTAVSSVVAYQKASDYFTQECEKRFSSECLPPAVLTSKKEADDYRLCDEALSHFDMALQEDTGDEVGKHKFICQGNCLLDENAFRRWMDGDMEETRRKCESNKLSKEVMGYSDLIGYTITEAELENQAKRQFVEILTSLCPISVVDVNIEEDLEDGVGMSTGGLCIGYDINQCGSHKENPSVECRKVK